MDGESIVGLLFFIGYIVYAIFKKLEKMVKGDGKKSSPRSLAEQAEDLEQEALRNIARLDAEEARLESSGLPRRQYIVEKIKLLEARLKLEHHTIFQQVSLLENSHLPEEQIRIQRERLYEEASRVEEAIRAEQILLREEADELDREEKKREQEKRHLATEAQTNLPPPPKVEPARPTFAPRKAPATVSTATQKSAIRELFRNKSDLARAILSKEILGPPPSL